MAGLPEEGFYSKALDKKSTVLICSRSRDKGEKKGVDCNTRIAYVELMTYNRLLLVEIIKWACIGSEPVLDLVFSSHGCGMSRTTPRTEPHQIYYGRKFGKKICFYYSHCRCA